MSMSTTITIISFVDRSCKGVQPERATDLFLGDFPFFKISARSPNWNMGFPLLTPMDYRSKRFIREYQGPVAHGAKSEQFCDNSVTDVVPSFRSPDRVVLPEIFYSWNRVSSTPI
jgi:hypothetical protein